MRRILLVASTSAACVALFVACSSSDSSTFTPTNPDSGNGGDDSGNFGFDSGNESGNGDSSAMCTPTMPGAATTAWTGPVANTTACMAADIDAYFTACLADGAQKPTCDAYVADASHATCVSCLEAAQGAGPIEWHASGSDTHHDYIINFPACVALKIGDVSADGCGAAWHTQLECERDACDACFAGGGTSDEIRTCACTAEGGSIDPSSGACRVPQNSSSFCTTYLKTRLTKCAGATDAGSPVDTCLPASGEARDVYIKRLMKISCGPPA